MISAYRLLTSCALVALALPQISSAVPLYSENFEIDKTSNWTVNNGPSDEAHNFFFDYSTVGVPAAPSGAGTHGLKLQANQTNGIFSGVSASPTGQNFAGDIKVTFDWWENVNGPYPVGGSGSTQMGTFGIGTSGTVAQWPGSMQDSIWFAGTGDGNSASDWRAYSPVAPTHYLDGAFGIYASAAGTNSSNPYYASFGTNMAPAAQSVLFPQQTGTTLVGSAGMEWHHVEIKRAGSIVSWRVDGVPIATVPVGDDTVAAGNNIFFGHSDVNATSSTDPNAGALLFTLIDNVVVEEAPNIPFKGPSVTFDFEDLAGTSPLFTSTKGSETIDVLSHGGAALDVFNSIGPSTWGLNSLANYFHGGDGIVINLSETAGGAAIEFGDYNDDDDSVTFTAYSGFYGTGSIIDTSSLSYPSALDLHHGDSDVRRLTVSGAGIRSLVVTSGSPFPGSVYWDNLTISANVPEPSTILLALLGLGAISRSYLTRRGIRAHRFATPVG